MKRSFTTDHLRSTALKNLLKGTWKKHWDRAQDMWAPISAFFISQSPTWVSVLLWSQVGGWLCNTIDYTLTISWILRSAANLGGSSWTTNLTKPWSVSQSELPFYVMVNGKQVSRYWDKDFHTGGLSEVRGTWLGRRRGWRVLQSKQGPHPPYGVCWMWDGH